MSCFGSSLSDKELSELPTVTSKSNRKKNENLPTLKKYTYILSYWIWKCIIAMGMLEPIRTYMDTTGHTVTHQSTFGHSLTHFAGHPGWIKHSRYSNTLEKYLSIVALIAFGLWRNSYTSQNKTAVDHPNQTLLSLPQFIFPEWVSCFSSCHIR